jgi:DNA-binding YbaB/EbfC family protein
MFDKLDLNNLDLNKMMSAVQENAQKMQEESANSIFTAKTGGGMVEISINGNSEVVDLQIDDSLLDDKDSLQILLISAMNDVIKKAEEGKRSQAMKMMMGNMDMSSIFGQK